MEALIKEGFGGPLGLFATNPQVGSWVVGWGGTEKVVLAP
jgi:hypothetical protein